MKKLLAFIVAALICLTCFAACGKKPETPGNNESTPTQVVYDVEDAAAYLKNMYKKYLTETETAADFTLVSQVMKGGVVYNITWSVDREDIKVIVDEANKQVKIDLDEKTKVDITYKLTATIKDPDGKTATLTFELKVPKYVLSSWKEYMAAEAGKAVVVEGYIAAVHAPSEGNKYNTLYLHDVNNEGGYYIYSMADSKDLVKDLGLKKGMLVSVTGTKDIYSGTHEIKDAVVNVLDTNIVDLKPLDITNTYKNANSLKDKELTDKLGMLVTIKGVEITDQDLSEKSMYLNFKLAGLTTYVRVYATDCPASVTDKGQESIITEHGKKKGYEADVTGVVVMYSGAIYLNPVSDTPFAYGKKIERTPEQMVQVEMDEVKFEKDITLDKTLTLPTKGSTYEDVVITWASNSAAITIDGNKAKIKLQDEATTASITATFTLGTITKTKTFEFNLAKKSGVVTQIVTTPVVGQAYKFFTIQEKLGGYYYFTGAYSDDRNQYGKSSSNVNDAIDVVLEAADGNKYYLTFGTGANKKYITIVATVGTDSKTGADKTYTNFNITDTKPATAFSFDTTYNTLVMPILDPLTNKTADYYMGTYNTYDTFSASALSYAATSFPSHLGTVVDSSKVSDAEKVATEKDGLSVESDEFFKNGEMPLALEGSIYSDVKIVWASNSEYAVVNGNKLNVTIPTATTKVTLTATLTCGNTTDTKTFDITITVVSTEAYAPVFVGIRPEEGKAYKYAVYQANKGAWLYADGTFGDRYLNTTENYNEGADYYAELVSTDVYKFYILEGTTKKYLTIYKNSSNKDAVKFDAAGTNTFTYDATTGAWVTDFDGTTYYVGTYNDFATLSASKTSYISAENTGVSQFPGAPVELKITETALKEGVAYKFAMNIPSKMLYIDGGLDSAKNRYFTATVNPSEGIDVYLEKANDGYKFYTLDGTTKKYLVAYLNGENKTSLKYDAAESTVFTFNSTTNIWMTNLDGTDYYMGTYTSNGTTFETVSLSKTSFINAENTGVSQFPLNLVAASFSVATQGGEGGNEGGNEGGSTTTPTTMPYTVGKEYVMQLNQTNLSKYLYLSGAMDGYYFGTTEDAAAAVKVVLEADGDGYQLYFMNGSTKTYITIVPSGTYNNTTFATEKPSVAWKWNGSLSTLTLTISSGEFFLGTYGTYSTISACAVSYVDNFKALLVDPATIEGGSGSGNQGGNEGGNEDGSTTPAGSAVATFGFGDNDSSKTNEANQDGSDAGTSYSESNNGYTLNLTGMSKVYKDSFDAKGNSCIKLGTKSVAGVFSFTVPNDVTSVKIYVAGYKSTVGKFTINGGSTQSTTKISANGEYDVITIDTSSNKTIAFTTVSGGWRLKINTIEFYK